MLGACAHGQSLQLRIAGEAIALLQILTETARMKTVFRKKFDNCKLMMHWTKPQFFSFFVTDQ